MAMLNNQRASGIASDITMAYLWIVPVHGISMWKNMISSLALWFRIYPSIRLWSVVDLVILIRHELIGKNYTQFGVFEWLSCQHDGNYPLPYRWIQFTVSRWMGMYPRNLKNLEILEIPEILKTSTVLHIHFANHWMIKWSNPTEMISSS